MKYVDIRQHKIGACQLKKLREFRYGKLVALRESDRYKIYTDIRSATEAVNL